MAQRRAAIIALNSFGTWRTDSFYLEHMHNIRASLSGRLHFAGEATSLSYYGYLHGAYFEGEERGKQIVKCIKSKPGGCGDLPSGGDFFDGNLSYPPNNVLYPQ